MALNAFFISCQCGFMLETTAHAARITKSMAFFVYGLAVNLLLFQFKKKSKKNKGENGVIFPDLFSSDIILRGKAREVLQNKF